ncbi:hypothetical protein [Pedobacter alpinus]|uniref:Uncharacterized protein n=1 Tax=Pedobacter alpinus TaxID=1590643 RepID=A0ABW5TN03_9SPHI
MKTEEDYMDWEKEAPLLCSIKGKQAFIVPENYFEDLNNQIKSSINLSQLGINSEGFTTPTNYFDSLQNDITSQISLLDIKNSNAGFNTPNDYFEKSKTTILDKTLVKSTNKSKIFNISFIRYAAAACILFATSVGVYMNIQHTNNVNYQLSKIADEDIENYLQSNVDANDLSLIIENLEEPNSLQLENSSTNDIQEYLNKTP